MAIKLISEAYGGTKKFPLAATTGAVSKYYLVYGASGYVTNDDGSNSTDINFVGIGAETATNSGSAGAVEALVHVHHPANYYEIDVEAGTFTQANCFTIVDWESGDGIDVDDVTITARQIAFKIMEYISSTKARGFLVVEQT